MSTKLLSLLLLFSTMEWKKQNNELIPLAAGTLNRVLHWRNPASIFEVQHNLESRIAASLEIFLCLPVPARCSSAHRVPCAHELFSQEVQTGWRPSIAPPSVQLPSPFAGLRRAPYEALQLGEQHHWPSSQHIFAQLRRDRARNSWTMLPSQPTPAVAYPFAPVPHAKLVNFDATEPPCMHSDTSSATKESGNP